MRGWAKSNGNAFDGQRGDSTQLGRSTMDCISTLESAILHLLTLMSAMPRPVAKTSRKTKSRPARRRRRSAEEARSEALASARKLLIERGPSAVTLKAVAD